MTVLAIWLGLFGMWPVLDPGHDPATPLGLADVLLHIVAGAYLWRTVSRKNPAT